MSDLNTFSRELDRALENITKKAEKKIRKVAFDGHRNIVTETPFDTGRAKANWQVEVNESPGESSIFVADKMTEDQANAAGYENGLVLNDKIKLGDVIHIFNNVEYIIPLEFDHASKQVPASGWVRSEAIRMENKLTEALKAI